MILDETLVAYKNFHFCLTTNSIPAVSRVMVGSHLRNIDLSLDSSAHHGEVEYCAVNYFLPITPAPASLRPHADVFRVSE